MTATSEIALNIDVDSFAAYSDSLQAAALTTTRLAATSLPTDLSFHRSINPALTHDLDVFSDRVLSLAGKLVRVASGITSRIQEEEDIVDDFVRNVVDPMEGMLEGTDGALDVFLGKKKAPSIPIPAIPVNNHQNYSKKQPFRGRLDPALTHAFHIPKPQLLFKHTLSNTDESPYIPATLIPHKWCAKVPLGYVFYDEKSNQGINDVSEYDNEEEKRKRTLHPYYYELTHPSCPDHVFNPPLEPSHPPSLDVPASGTTTISHPLTFVSTPKALLSMANTISSATELAVDLEHHSYRSYRGFLALMQISTREEDFVVDLLVPELREGLRQAKEKGVRECEEARTANEAGQIIARVFADPSVIKVFHGAESDVVWLQQDFNIFVVGLFDTFHASKLLEFPKHSLAHLLETYCDFIPDKRYQLADWRIRPVPTEMLTYARSDTHFLLYVYDMLRLSLIERPSTNPAMSDELDILTDTKQASHDQGLIHRVLMRSSRTCLRLYEIEPYDAEGGTGSSGWDTLARKWNKIGLLGLPSHMRGTETEGSQTTVYKAVHRWREDIAREEDESTRYVLSTHHLFLLVERAPTTIPGLLSLFGGPGGVSGSVPPILKRRVGELVMVIKSAMEASKSRLNLQGAAETSWKGTEAAEPETMRLPMSSSSAAKLIDESRLWAVTPPSTSGTALSISRSTLFGIGLSEVHAQEKGATLPSSVSGEETLSATRSILFGRAISKTATPFSFTTTKPTFTSERVSDDSTKRFEDVVEKIHKRLAIAPIVSVPLLAPSLGTQASATSHLRDSIVPEESDHTPPGPEGQIEIPFVPAHKRQTLASPQNQDDTIVVVGQAGARQRKRKRDKSRGIAMGSKYGAQLSGQVSAPTDDHDREMEEFDYSSIPNLLDDESKHGQARGAHEDDERRKKRQRHGKGSGLLEYGNFRVPPRDQREVKSGNKTHTFR